MRHFLSSSIASNRRKILSATETNYEQKRGQSRKGGQNYFYLPSLQKTVLTLFLTLF